MDQQIENRCLGLVENYRILSAGSKLEFQEMVLACAGIYLAAGIEPDMGRMQECKKLLKSRAGIFSNFRGSDELLVRCKMALADDPALYFERLEREYQRIKTFFSGEQTVLAAMILAEQGSSEGLAEKTKQIYKEMKEAHPWLTSENDLPFAAVMAVSGRDATSVYAEAEEIYALLNGKLKADKDTMQMLSHILAIRVGLPSSASWPIPAFPPTRWLSGSVRPTIFSSSTNPSVVFSALGRTAAGCLPFRWCTPRSPERTVPALPHC